jgi:hypothetical protein
MQQMSFIAHLIACSTCFGHHYAHHQELESIIQVIAVCRIWYCKDGKSKFLRFAVVEFPALSVVCHVRLCCFCGLGMWVSGLGAFCAIAESISRCMR